MRSRATNVLQTVILITGSAYILIGIFFYISPLSVLELFTEHQPENWIDLVSDNSLVAPLYFITRAFSALLFASGISMVLPLFDPLKYRILVYFNGVIFPLFITILFLANLSSGKVIGTVLTEEGQRGFFHKIIFILGIIFIVILLLSMVSLTLTHKQAREGKE